MSLETQIADTAVNANTILGYVVVLLGSILSSSKLLSHVAGERSKMAAANLETAEKKAGIDIIEQLQRRMSELEREQRDLRSELDEERARRAEAEDMVDALTRRVDALEAHNRALMAQLRGLGVEPVGGGR